MLNHVSHPIMFFVQECVLSCLDLDDNLLEVLLL